MKSLWQGRRKSSGEKKLVSLSMISVLVDTMFCRDIVHIHSVVQSIAMIFAD